MVSEFSPQFPSGLSRALFSVPGPPASLIDRVKYLEDHIIKLERDHPPWAALHFNQPNRGVYIPSLSHASFLLNFIYIVASAAACNATHHP